jgi:hypothetical protein
MVSGHVLCVRGHVLCVRGHVLCVRGHVLCVRGHVLCVGSIDFASFYDFSTGIWKCSERYSLLVIWLC